MYPRRAGLALLLFVSAGCTSYSFRGSQPNSSDKNLRELPSSFRIASYSYELGGQGMPNPWSTPRNVGSSVDKSVLQKSLAHKYPDLFTDEDESIPLDVIVTFTSGNADFWGLVPYFLSLGILPSRIVYYTDRCEVRTSISEDRKARAKRSDIAFSSKCWLSVWTPLPLLMSDSPREFTGAYRSGYGVMAAPHLNNLCLQNQKDVFTDTVAEGVVSCIGTMDKADLQRQAVLNNLKGAK